MADMEKLEQRISELERRIQMQEDIRAIERLQANYWDCLDKKDWDGLRACFTDDFVFINNTTGGRYVGGDGMLHTVYGGCNCCRAYVFKSSRNILRKTE